MALQTDNPSPRTLSHREREFTIYKLKMNTTARDLFLMTLPQLRTSTAQGYNEINTISTE